MLSIGVLEDVGLIVSKDVNSRTQRRKRTKRVSALLEVIQESLAHADGAPFVLLFNERHVCGRRAAVGEGQREKACTGEESRAASRQDEPRRMRTGKVGVTGRKQGQTASNRMVTQRGNSRW